LRREDTCPVARFVASYGFFALFFSCFSNVPEHFPRPRVARWWILKYSNMMRRLIDTDYSKVANYSTHTYSAQQGKFQSAPARPGAEEMEGLGVTSDYDTTQHAHAQKIFKAQRRRQAQDKMLGSGVSPDCNTTQRGHAQNITKRSSKAERSGEGVRGSPPAAI